MPAPWGHDGSSPKKDLSNSKNNAGYWEDIYLEPSTGELQGILSSEVPSDYERIGKAVKEVSPGISTWLDGDGNVWEDTLNHVALVVKPTQGNQDNFVPLSQLADNFKCTDATPAIALSLYDEIMENVQHSESKKGGDPTSTAVSESDLETQRKQAMKDVIDILNQVGIPVGEDATQDNLAERIRVVGKALIDNGITSIPKLGKERSGHAIALDTNDPLDINHPSPVVKFAVKSHAKNYEQRIQALLDTGRCTAVYAKERLEPLCQGIVLSLDDDGEPQANTSLDLVLNALESLPEYSALSQEVIKAGKGKKGSSPKIALSIVGAEEVKIPAEYTQSASEQLAKLSPDSPEVTEYVKNLYAETGRQLG